MAMDETRIQKNGLKVDRISAVVDEIMKMCGLKWMRVAQNIDEWIRGLHPCNGW